MKESMNLVNISGTVESLDIKHIARKDGGAGEYLAGTVVVRSSDKNGNVCTIPVDFFTSQYKKDGTLSKIYTNLLGMESWNSIASAGEENATRVEIRGAKIVENLFVPQNSEDVMSAYKITSNFFTKANAMIEDKNEFKTTGCVVDIAEETKANADGDVEATGRLIVRLAVVGYNDKVEVLKFFVENKDAVDFIQANWQQGDCIQCGGYFKFTAETFEKTVEMGFGEPETKSYTRNTKEMIITRGSREAIEEGADGYANPEDIKKGLAVRKDLMAQTLAKSKEKKAPAVDTTSGYGF